MNKKSKFKVKPNIELMAIESKTVSPEISMSVGFKIQREKRIKAFTE